VKATGIVVVLLIAAFGTQSFHADEKTAPVCPSKATGAARRPVSGWTA
jgi:hypothetical protein